MTGRSSPGTRLSHLTLRLNINTDAVVGLTNKLEKLHRSALPAAVRGALNDAVFNVKTKTMPAEAQATFKQRQPNFFKANSKFEKAEGFNINRMRSTVGFYENKLTNQATNYAVKDLERQEGGGQIDGKAFIPMRQARGGRGLVRANARIAAIKKGLVNAQKVKSSRNAKQRLIRAAIKAKELHGGNAFILGNRVGGSQTLFKVNKIVGLNSGKLFMKLTPLYRVKKDRTIRVEKTGFMQRASMETAMEIDKFYIRQALRQLDKFWKR